MLGFGSGDKHVVKDLPIGIDASGKRTEFDSMGKVDVPADKYWGAQTQRSLHHFSIGRDKMPIEVYRAYGTVKKACALVNQAEGRLADWKAAAIVRAADEAITGQLDEHFPLFVWQTGSGTQSNMNVNEVLSNRAIQLLGGTLGTQEPVGPNDDVNMGQSSNDSFPSAMHVAAVTLLDDRLIPELDKLATAIEAKANAWMDVVKIGRTHLEDAVPLSVGQEWSGWAAQIRAAMAEVERSREGLYELALGGTAVGTGLNAPPGFSRQVAAEIAGADGQAVRHRAQQVHGAGLAGRDRAGFGGAARRRGRADEGRQRHALARLRPALRPGRAEAAGERARLVHHARQGQPDAVRGDRDDLHPGDRRRHRGGVRGQPGQFRAERDAADRHQQLPALGDDPGGRMREVPDVLGRRHGAEPREDRAATSTTR